MGSKQKKILAGCGVLLLLVFVISVFVGFRHPQTITVTLVFDNPTDTQNATIHFNFEKLAAITSSDIRRTYALSPGTYTLTIDKAGYKQFSTNFAIQIGQPVVVNIHLKLATTPETLTSLGQIASSPGESTFLASTLPTGADITQIEYFDDQTWAFVTINLHAGIGTVYAVAQYNPSTGVWAAITVPKEDFTEDDLQHVPADLEMFISNNYYIDSGSTS